DGVIAAHISNRHLDLQPVFWQLAQEYGLKMVRIANEAGAEEEFPSEWLLLTSNEDILNIPQIHERALGYEGYSTSIPIWTDDYSNLFQILR
ncbi:MAG TPA: hypothetical protein PLR93_02950, partial [Anaerolineales bacterium]|nr:hypothetical protein [Anaerolineales bacterium]